MKARVLFAAIALPFIVGFMPNIPKELGEFKGFKPGAWSSYMSITKEDTTKIYFSVLSDKESEKQGGWWIEMEIVGEDNHRVITKYIVEKDPRNTGGKTGKMIIKMDDMPAYTIKVEPQKEESENNYDKIPAMDKESEANETSAPREKLIKVGKEKITVSAGTFDVTHYQTKNEKGRIVADLWFSQTLPLFPLVKAVGTDEDGKYKMELTSYGESGAKELIKEKPKDFNMMEMMKGLMKNDTEEEK